MNNAETAADYPCIPEQALNLSWRKGCRDIEILRTTAKHYVTDSTAYNICFASSLLDFPYCPESILIYLVIGYRMFLLRINLCYRNTPAFTVILITYEHGSTLVKQGILCKTNRKITSDCPCFSLMLSSGHD